MGVFGVDMHCRCILLEIRMKCKITKFSAVSHFKCVGGTYNIKLNSRIHLISKSEGDLKLPPHIELLRSLSYDVPISIQ